jgi:hypothetical protein
MGLIMCEHNFQLLRERGSIFVFFCTKCLAEERRIIPLREPDSAADEAAEWRRRELLRSLDAQAVLFAKWLDDGHWNTDPKGLRLLIPCIDQTLAEAQAVGLIVDDVGGPLLFVRLRMLEKLAELSHQC